MPTNFWSTGFRFGLYDRLMPINYDQSIQAAFAALEPKPDDHILDAGCGSGRLLVHARDWLKSGGRLTGIDIDEAGLTYAQRRAERLGIVERVQLLKGDLTNLAELKLPTFDRVMSHFAIYTIPTDEARRQAVRCLAATLKPGGRLVFVGPSEHYSAALIMADTHRLEQDRTDIGSFRRSIRRRLVYPITHRWLKKIEAAIMKGPFHRYTQAELREHLTDAGIHEIHTEPTYAGCGWRAVGIKR
jgi:ubiquinone/menaquinone biosynthesis C-methylase UbiE